MSKKIHTSAGNGGALGGHPTRKFQVGGTDLGFLFEGGKGLWVGGVFGDTFGGDNPGSENWRSPVMGRTSNRDFLERGIQWDNFAGAANTGGNAKQIFPYNHNGKNNARVNSGNFDSFTIIPNDIIQVPDGRYFGMGFRVQRWSELDTSKQAMCYTASNAWFWSDEPHADSWQVGRYRDNLGRLYEWENSGRNQYFQNATFLQVPGEEDTLYVFGSREGRKVGRGPEEDGVFLRRAKIKDAFTEEGWEYWGWTGSKWEWGRNVWPTPILKPITPGSWIGEINAQHIGGKVVLTYADSIVGSVALTADRPDSIWSDPVVLVSRLQEPFGYAPSVHPWSPSLTDAYIHNSSWKQIPNPFKGGAMETIDYCAYGYRGSLVAAPTPQQAALTMDSEVLAPDTSQMTEQQRCTYVETIHEATKEANS